MMDGDGMARASKEEVFIAYAVSRGWAGCILGLNLENVLAVSVKELKGTDTKLVKVAHPPGVLPWYSPPSCVTMWS
ncbi:hypothetical protein LCGC14_1212130 [marine sediment metagenome]|uniref:Uncharacterized protein n=1 Tax=marine sediment metagenome TaxID=412755 RepID=A0A0F9PIC1_9ZZZZ